MRRVATCLLSWSMALAFPDDGAAQHTAGVVLGFDGKPASRAVVQLFDDGGRCGEVLTDEDGAFAFAGDGPLRRIDAQIEAVVVSVPVAADRQERITATFAGVAHFRLRGHVVDPGGLPAAGCDLVARGARGDTAGTVTTDARGAFTLRSNQPLTSLLVDPLGWRHDLAGPWQHDQGVAIDLRLHRDEFFCVRGHAFDDARTPLPDTRVQARARGEQRAWTTTRADGSFSLWARGPFDELALRELGRDIAVLGDGWQGDAQVVVSTREHGLVPVTGRVVDAAGKGVEGALLFTASKAGWPGEHDRPITRAGAGGWFRVQVPRTYPALVAIAGGQRGRVAWQDADPVRLEVR